MFFFIIGIILGVYVAQEYDKDLPNVKQVVRRASSILREAIRGENDDDGKNS